MTARSLQIIPPRLEFKHHPDKSSSSSSRRDSTEVHDSLSQPIPVFHHSSLLIQAL